MYCCFEKSFFVSVVYLITCILFPNIGIFGSETGSIRIVNLATKERLRLKTKYPISKIEIIEDITKTSKVRSLVL